MISNCVHRLIFIFIIYTAIGIYKEGHSMPYSAMAECTNGGADCGPGNCCVIGMQRYSVPSCARLGQLEDYCISGGTSKNLTLAFPNGLSIRVANTYTLFCPCDETQELVCHRAQCVYKNTVV